jgi:hypothetical protein
MNDASSYAIKFPGTTGGHRWHPIAGGGGDVTEAMNIAGGVLVRTTVTHDEWTSEESKASSVGVSMVRIEGWTAAKRWAVRVEHPHFDDEEDREREGAIYIEVEYDIIQQRSVSIVRELIVQNPVTKRPEFRWYFANDDMPRPTPDQARAVAMHSSVEAQDG